MAMMDKFLNMMRLNSEEEDDFYDDDYYDEEDDYYEEPKRKSFTSGKRKRGRYNSQICNNEGVKICCKV